MQASEQHYNECLPHILAIPAEEVTYANLPPAVATVEAAHLSSVAAADREELLGSGISVLLLDQVPIRAAAYLYAVARYNLFAEETAPGLIFGTGRSSHLAEITYSQLFFERWAVFWAPLARDRILA